MSEELKRDTFRVGKMTRVHPDSQFQQDQIHYEHIRISLFRMNSEKLFLKDLTKIYKSYKCDSPETFSVALWVKPFVVNGGRLIHLSTNIGGSSLACFDLLGFSPSGQSVGQLYNSYVAYCLVAIVNVRGSTVLVNTWTHIVLTYSSSNGLIIYTNGTLRGMTDSFSSFPSASPNYKTGPYMTVGNQGTSVTSNVCCCK